jgi:hypothetical protein
LFLIDWAVRAAVLAVLAGLAIILVRIRYPRTRLALWSALLCGTLVLPALRQVMPPLLPPARTPYASLQVPAAVHYVLTPANARAIVALPKDIAPRRTYY